MSDIPGLDRAQANYDAMYPEDRECPECYKGTNYPGELCRCHEREAAWDSRCDERPLWHDPSGGLWP